MKQSNSNLILINATFCMLIVIANVVTSKVIDTGLLLWGRPIMIPGAAITYAFTFLCTDIIGEVWGKTEANAAVKRGLFVQIFATLLILLTKFLPSVDPAMQEAYDRLLGQNWVFVVASLIGYYCSQTWDVWIFHKIRDRFEGKPNYRWIWNNASTLSSQIWDTVIFISIGFGLGMGWFFQEGGLMIIVNMIIGQYLLKAVLALIDTPIFYLFTKRK